MSFTSGLASTLNVPIFSGGSMPDRPGMVNLPEVNISAAAEGPAASRTIPGAALRPAEDKSKIERYAKRRSKPKRGSDQVSTTDTPVGSIGVFTTPQTLMAFPVAATIVTLIWKVLARVFPAWGGSMLVALMIALVVGFVIYVNSQPNAKTLRDKFVAASVALFNCFVLAATALGINSVS
jgi:hypothetical protein